VAWMGFLSVGLLGGHGGCRRCSGAVVEVPRVRWRCFGGGGGCPFHCIRCASCSGRVASFMRRCLGLGCSLSWVCASFPVLY
jgi:hypothetical protein